VLRVRATSGVELAPDEVTVEVALTSVGADAAPGRSLDLRDPNCGAPTADVPTCGQFLLPNGATGHVTLSVGSCDGLVNVPGRADECLTVGSTEALVVTGIANLKDEAGNPLYSRSSPATLIIACDKVLCGMRGVPQPEVIFTLENTGDLTQTALPCPAKGVIGADQDACVDYVSSSRSQSDLYLHLLFVADARCGF
jgi:hypothetical protein